MLTSGGWKGWEKHYCVPYIDNSLTTADGTVSPIPLLLIALNPEHLFGFATEAGTFWSLLFIWHCSVLWCMVVARKFYLQDWAVCYTFLVYSSTLPRLPTMGAVWVTVKSSE